MKKLFSTILVICSLLGANAYADCYDDVGFNWKFINYNNEIQFEFLNNTDNKIFINEYGVKTADKQIVKNNIYSSDVTNSEILNSLTYVSLKKFGRSIKKIYIHDINSKFIKYGYFKCKYLN
jgi:hypothetical protein